MFIVFVFPNEPDLRDDKQFCIDHPGAVPISTDQVKIFVLVHTFPEMLFSYYPFSCCMDFFYLQLSSPYSSPFSFRICKGEELKNLIGSHAYIECSSKTQQVYIFFKCIHIFYIMEYALCLRDLLTSLQNVKAVFDAAIRVVLQPPKQKKKKSKVQKACSIL